MKEPSHTNFEVLLSTIENALKQRLKSSASHSENTSAHKKLLEAMSYSVLGAGKRLRPLLCCATSIDLNSTYTTVLPAACALEFIHAYSLIHDDLPSMDNDKLRRGKPTCHIAFGEAAAILAGDALQALAFEILANAESINSSTRIHLVQILARAAGSVGMVGGQCFDMQATNTVIGLSALEQLHSEKTGALISAAVNMGAICAGADQNCLNTLDAFARKLGLAFQVVDDILDETQSTEVLGKQAGADRKLGKNTFPSLMGLEQAQNYAVKLEKECFDLLSQLGLRDGYLAALVTRIIHRAS